MKDYTTARFFAISGLGYGKGDSIEEARENYVKTQLRNFRASDTVFGTRPKFKAALETGECAPDVWQAPEGTRGFVYDDRGLHWYDADDAYTDATAEHLVERAVDRNRS